MKKLYVLAARSMNYLFLQYTVGNTELNGILKEELRLFLEEVAKDLDIDEGYYEIIKVELKEGLYLDNCSHQKFSDLLSKSIYEIMGEVDESLYNLYTYISGDVIEDSESKSELE
ncbi:hypothetical protein MZM54_03350 [[Brevibacterium] frigoritolerans]|nr:hypothetical protein [Peribacillus frigoritolerans]